MNYSSNLFINGKRLEGDGEIFNNVNPSNGKVIAAFRAASFDQLDDAVASSKIGQDKWAKFTPAERGRVLRKAADLLREKNDELAELEVLETGKPISEAIEVDILSGADAIEYFAGMAATLKGDFHQLGKNFVYTKKEPFGVCLGIGAWNYPIQIACWKSAPALACGNSMIFKPAELTPSTAVELAEIYSKAGLPDGVFNVVQGGTVTGDYLVRHPQIDKVSITGEVSTGKKVMAAASNSLKNISLELGGKSPIIIFNDADLNEAVQGAMLGNFYTQGEICSNGTRVYVQKESVDQFLQLLLEKSKKLKIGDPTNPTTQIGALISADHLEKVIQAVENGKSFGKLLLGGKRFIPNDKKIAGGYYFEPTIFYSEENNCDLVNEEIFGPVMTVLPFDKEDDAISLANNTPYGLAGGVFTNDLQKGHRIADALKCGVCWINNYNITPVEVPFGGYKQSGIGRENGYAAIENYTQTKTVYVEMSKIDSPYK